MNDHLPVGEVAALYGVAPKLVSDLLYFRRIDAEKCPIHSGRRWIPRDLLPQVEHALRRQGKLPQTIPAD